jgi:hypothetical protein
MGKMNKKSVVSLKVILVFLAMLLGVAYAYEILGATVVWSVTAAVVVATGVTLVSTLEVSYEVSGLHGCIDHDLVAMSKNFEHHFEDTLTAIQKNGEETRKTILEMHKSLKEESEMKR